MELNTDDYAAGWKMIVANLADDLAKQVAETLAYQRGQAAAVAELEEARSDIVGLMADLEGLPPK